MARVDHAQTDFTAGEISPLLTGRTDIEKYISGLNILENAYVTPHGPLIKRGGTQYLGEVKHSDKITNLISFSVSVDVNYILEFGDKYIRFYTEQGQLVHVGVDLTATTLWLVTTAYVVDDKVYNIISGIVSTYICILDHTSAAGDKPGVGVNWETYWTLLETSTVARWLVTTAYVIGDYVENGGDIYYCILGHTSAVGDEPGVGGSWTTYWVQQEQYEIPTTYLETEVMDIGITQSNDVLFIAHKDHAPAVLERADVYDWRLSNISFIVAPADWGANNYPQVVTIMEQRLIWANIPSKPQTLWASRSADYYKYNVGLLDSDAFEYTIGSDKLNVIRWMSPGEILAIGTSGAEFKMSSNSLGEAITPTNINIKRQTNFGCAPVPAIRINDKVIFVQKGGKKVRNFHYTFETNSYDAEDLTILSEHITGGLGVKIEGAGYCNEPNSIWWGYRTDGVLIGMSYEPTLKTIGWFRYVISGTDAKVKALACIDNATDKTQDDVYLIVSRTINGATVQYVEFIRAALRENEDQKEAFYVDSGLSYDEALPTDTFSNAEHLEGETVRILADGARHPDVIISGGSFTLAKDAQRVHMGLGFDSLIKTLKIEGGNPIGVSQGKTQRISKVIVRLYKSIGLKVGDEDKQDIIRFGPGVMNEAPDLFSGFKDIEFDGEFTDEALVTILHDEPLPLTIISIITEYRTQ